MRTSTTHALRGVAGKARYRRGVLSLGASCLALMGCAAWSGRKPEIENELVEHYRHVAENMAVPDLNQPASRNTPNLGNGRPLEHFNDDQLRLISLAEAIDMGIRNNKILRQNAQFLAPSNPVLVNPDGVPSIFDRDIQDSGVVFGARGTEAALSSFDPRLTINSLWGRDENKTNTVSAGVGAGQELRNDYWQFQSRLDQQLLSGGTIGLKHNVTRGASNAAAASQAFPSAYTGLLGFDFRQPLWSGAGSDVTSIAGPTSQQSRGFSPINQGIVIARINNRLSAIDFEENIQNLVREIGDLYWELYQAYHEYAAERATAADTRKLWESLEAKYDAGKISKGDFAQAEDAYFDAESRERQSLAQLYQTESKMRRMLGLPIDDGQLLSPSDAPRSDRLISGRETVLSEALRNRLELRRQKTNLHSLQLQMSAAQNLLSPKLDFVTGYSLNGFGHHLDGNPGGPATPANGFYPSLFNGAQTSWNAGLEYSLPLWLRSERAQLRQVELRILKGRAALALQEDEIARELNAVFQNLDKWHLTIGSYRRRLAAAKRRVEALQSSEIARAIELDAVLKAQLSATQAQIAYDRSLSEYNKTIRELLYRSGRLLAGDGIQIIGTGGPEPDEPGLSPPRKLPPVPELKEFLDPDSTVVRIAAEFPSSEVAPPPPEKKTPQQKSHLLPYPGKWKPSP